MSLYLVTGAAGFIGGALAKRLIENGHEVVTIDNLSTGAQSNIPKGVHFIEGDCQDIQIINSLTDFQFEAIYHIAGQSSGEISFDNPMYDLQTNAQSTLLLMKYAMANACKKFIYASTMSVYGDQPEEPISEICSTKPKSFYGVGKLASEHYMRIYSDLGLQCTALRLFNVYGPGQNMDNMRQGMVSIFVSQAIKYGHILVKGDKKRFRDFVYISDVVDAFISAAIENKGNSYSCFNVCNQKPCTVEELINSIRSNFENEVSVEFKGSTPGDQFGIYGDNNQLKSHLNWKPKVTLDEGLSLMCKWAKKELS